MVKWNAIFKKKEIRMVNIDYVGIGLHTHTHMQEYIASAVCMCIFISRLALSGVAYACRRRVLAHAH